MTALRVCSESELEVNQAYRVVVDGVAVAIVKDSAGTYFAIGDTCTHGDISLAEGFVENETLECWAHGSKFSLRTGRPLSLPAFVPVPVYEISVEDGVVFVDVATPKQAEPA